MGRPQVFNEEDVINKALEVFWQKGYYGTSTRDLTNATGISNGSLFNSFGDKKHLYLKCLQKYDSVYITKFEKLLNEAIPFKTKIKKVFLYVIKKTPNKKTYEGCFSFNTSIDNGIADISILDLVNDIQNRLESAFISAIEMAVQNHEIPGDTNVIPLAQYLLNIVNGLRVLLLNQPDPQVVDNIINTTLKLLPGT